MWRGGEVSNRAPLAKSQLRLSPAPKSHPSPFRAFQVWPCTRGVVTPDVSTHTHDFTSLGMRWPQDFVQDWLSRSMRWATQEQATPALDEGFRYAEHRHHVADPCAHKNDTIRPSREDEVWSGSCCVCVALCPKHPRHVQHRTPTFATFCQHVGHTAAHCWAIRCPLSPPHVDWQRSACTAAPSRAERVANDAVHHGHRDAPRPWWPRRPRPSCASVGRHKAHRFDLRQSQGDAQLRGQGGRVFWRRTRSRPLGRQTLASAPSGHAQ